MISISTNQLQVFNGMLLIPLQVNKQLELPTLLTSPDNEYCIEIYTSKEKNAQKRSKEPRSLSANAYMWVLCQMVAEGLSERNGVVIRKEEIYRKNIRELFTPNTERDKEIAYSDHFADWLVPDIKREWENKGIGWICEEAGPAAIYGRTWLNFYKGSSQYNKAQMSRLIEGIKDDARNAGISVSTKYDEDLDKMLDAMEKARKKRGENNEG